MDGWLPVTIVSLSRELEDAMYEILIVSFTKGRSVKSQYQQCALSTIHTWLISQLSVLNQLPIFYIAHTRILEHFVSIYISVYTNNLTVFKDTINRHRLGELAPSSALLDLNYTLRGRLNPCFIFKKLVKVTFMPQYYSNINGWLE